MTDRDQTQAKPRINEKRGTEDKNPVVGRDVPDESKERHTEIAVDAGRKVGAEHD